MEISLIQTEVYIFFNNNILYDPYTEYNSVDVKTEFLNFNVEPLWKLLTFDHHRGVGRELSFGVHGRDLILRRVIKITSERSEDQVIRVHDTHKFSGGSVWTCPFPRSTAAM